MFKYNPVDRNPTAKETVTHLWKKKIYKNATTKCCPYLNFFFQKISSFFKNIEI